MRSSRHALDRYDSPDWMTRALLDRHPYIGGGLGVDPCSGSGGMAALLAPRFERLQTNDIDPLVLADRHEDARKPHFYDGLAPDWVITNPPFRDAAIIVFHALSAARVGVAMLLRCTFLEPVGGREWLAERPPTDLISLPRHRWKGLGAGTDQAPVWWFIWRQGASSACGVVSKLEALALHGSPAPRAVGSALPQIAPGTRRRALARQLTLGVS